MKNIFFILIFLSLTGCITTNLKDEDSPQVITIPKGDKRIEIDNLKQAKANRKKNKKCK